MSESKPNTKLVFYLSIPILLLLLTGGWFYWYQIRPRLIKSKCYQQNYLTNEFNYEWAEGKNWTGIPNSYNRQYGWLYPRNLIESRIKSYNECLILKGI